VGSLVLLNVPKSVSASSYNADQYIKYDLGDIQKYLYETLLFHASLFTLAGMGVSTKEDLFLRNQNATKDNSLPQW
jgi:hypothetical protein